MFSGFHPQLKHLTHSNCKLEHLKLASHLLFILNIFMSQNFQCVHYKVCQLNVRRGSIEETLVQKRLMGGVFSNMALEDPELFSFRLHPFFIRYINHPDRGVFIPVFKSRETISFIVDSQSHSQSYDIIIIVHTVDTSFNINCSCF